MLNNYAARILSLPDERLEAFVRDWISRRTRDYVESQRWSGPGDMGRDVVGYVTKQRHEGDWDNFQCKQLGKRLSEHDAFLELGKVFMHAAAGEYRLPRKYYCRHLRDQRVRYFDAAAFKRYYRDSTTEQYVATFEEDMYHGVADVYSTGHKDKLERLSKVMVQAAAVQPSGVLAKYARVPVKQGICHHFANEGRLPW